MILKFFKSNINYLVSLILVFTFIFFGCTSYIMRLDSNLYMDYMKNIEVGEIYFVNAKLYNHDYCIKNFKVNPIPTTLLEDIQNNAVQDWFFFKSPLMFVEDDSLSVNEIVMDYETYRFNNSPSIAKVSKQNDDKFDFLSIAYDQFYPIRGSFLHIDAVDEYDIRYYGITVTEDNKSSLCEFVNHDGKRNAYSGTYYLHDYYGKNIDRSNYDYDNIGNVSLLTSWVISFLSTLLFLNYGKKNKKDVYLLYIHGESRLKIFTIIFSIPILCVCIALIISIPLCYLYAYLFNLLASNLIPCVSFGSCAWRLIGISFVTILVVTILESLLYTLFFKRINKEDNV